MTSLTRLAAIAVCSGVAVAPLAAPATSAAALAHPTAAASAPRTSSAAAAAAGYLARKLGGKHHDHYTSSFKNGGKVEHFVNYGETADAVLSMDASGASQAAAVRATKYLAANATGPSYIGGPASSGFSPGAIGKVMLVAEAQHANVRSFGGVNLVAALRSTEGNGTPAGEYQQNPAGTDPADAFFSTVSQALPVLALANDPRINGQPDAAAVSFLAAQQCANGGFPSQLQSDPATACEAGQDVDSTGYAVQALLAAGDHADAEQGISWLRKVQHKNGSFGEPGNANSTALAIQALVAGHAPIGHALRWLRSDQIGCSGSVARRGAVAFTGGTFDDRALLATSQAGAALARAPLASIDKTGAHGGSPVLACPARPKR